MHINNWPKPNKTIYNQHDVIKKGDDDMQVLSMLGLSGDDIAKLEEALKSMAETPSKIDALIARIDKLEEAVKNGTGCNGSGAGIATDRIGGCAEHGTAIDENGTIAKF